MKKLITIILISSAYILGIGPFADKLIKMYRQKIKNNLKHQENSVKVLCEMGFKRDKVNQALKLKS